MKKEEDRECRIDNIKRSIMRRALTEEVMGRDPWKLRIGME